MTEAGYAKMFGVDSAEILKYDKLFLILGKKCNTRKDSIFQWYKNGEPIHFDYMERTVIASGKTPQELLNSVREYKRLLRLSRVADKDAKERE